MRAPDTWRYYCGNEQCDSYHRDSGLGDNLPPSAHAGKSGAFWLVCSACGERLYWAQPGVEIGTGIFNYSPDQLQEFRDDTEIWGEEREGDA